RISGDGRFVAIESFAGNLVDGDTNGVGDIFVHDRVTGATERVSVATDGTQGDQRSLVPAISADGRFVAFDSDATGVGAVDTDGVGDIFVHDRVTGVTQRVSVESNGTQRSSGSFFPAISADGRYVEFEGGGTGGDIFVRDRIAGTTERANVASDGSRANDITV